MKYIFQMPIRFINIDLGMVVLNTTSFGVVLLSWFSEHLGGIGGFIVALSVATLNFAKAYNNYKSGKNADSKK